MRLSCVGLTALVGCTTTPIEVQQFGGMRSALRLGNTSSQITFEDINSSPHAFGVGALTDLEGEITVVDGQIIVAKTEDGIRAISSTSNNSNDSATLLTLAYVDEWREYKFPSSMNFEDAVESVAAAHGIDTNTPFPFYILATTEAYEMHVINGFCPVITPDLEPKDQPWRLHGVETTLLIVGFFAKNQEGVMTHHGSSVHIHGIDTSRNEMVSGHLDSVAVQEGSTIFLPVP